MRYRDPIRLVTRKSGHKFWLFRERRGGTVHKIPWVGDLPKEREKIEIPQHILDLERAERDAKAAAQGRANVPTGKTAA